MRRTQIYLSEKQHSRIGRIAKRQGLSRSQYIRDVLDKALASGAVEPDWKAAIMAGAGLWRDRPEAGQDILAARRTLDRDVFARRA